MNENPHVHEIVVARRHASINIGPWELSYGDVTLDLAESHDDPYRWPKDKFQRKIRELSAQAIREHDEHSRAAAQAQDFVAELNWEIKVRHAQQGGEGVPLIVLDSRGLVARNAADQPEGPPAKRRWWML